jgi:hypothetical protein
MDFWYSGAKREAFPDSGRFVAGPYRLVLHTTEGGSYAGARAAYLKSKVTPHFTASYEGGQFQCWQHVPLDKASSALEHRAGTVETNRQSAVQIEVVAYAAQPDWSAGLVSGVAGLIAWIRQQCGVTSVAPPFLPYPASYGKTAVRMDPATWLVFDGVCGHMHVPFQDHGDPGAIPIEKLLTLTSPTPPAAPPPAPKEVEGVRLSHGSIPVAALDDQGRGWVSIPAPLERIVALSAQGSAPERDQKYWPAVTLNVNDSGDRTVVTLAGAPRQATVVYYSTLEDE